RDQRSRRPGGRPECGPGCRRVAPTRARGGAVSGRGGRPARWAAEGVTSRWWHATKDPSRRAAETRSFGTTKREVLALADWLRSWQVPAMVMEATLGDYWKGPFCRQEAEGVRVRAGRCQASRGTCTADLSATRPIPGGWR